MLTSGEIFFSQSTRTFSNKNSNFFSTLFAFFVFLVLGRTLKETKASNLQLIPLKFLVFNIERARAF